MERAPIVLLIVILGWVAGQEDRNELTYTIREEVSVGTTIGDLVRDSGLQSRHPDSVLEELNFQFLAVPPVNISIGLNNGLLFTNGRIDREYVCPMKKVCVIHLDVAVQPVTYFEIIKVAVTITDINDNAPTFAESTFSLSIKESASVNSSFLLPSAFDLDSPAKSIKRYEVLPDTPKSKFALRVTQKLDGSTDVRLVLKRSLDREQESSFSIQIVAFDGGGESGSLEVKVTVLDSNDHDPVFVNSTYEVSISENTPVRSMIMRVHATDKDIGENGEVIYGFSAQTETSYGNIFGIDQESGEIYIKQELDHEASPVYNLLVTAQDLGPDSLPADATVIIHIIDINDNPPKIKVNTLSDSEQSLIKEDSPVDTFVAHVTVKDPDAGNNGLVNCTLNDNSFKLARRYENEYQVLTAKVLDREMTAKYNLAIICRDGGVDPLIAIQHLQVNVDDVNDNSPIFNQSSYSSTLIENSYIGAFVTQVNATDKDTGPNADIKYSLSGDHAAFFSISDTGRVTARRSMDHEEHENFQLYVNATDHGSPRRSSSALVVVSIEDVNDETPMFTESLFSFSIEENSPSGEYVGQVAAEDRDSPPYNSFLFTMRPGVGVDDAFVLDPLTGSLKSKTSLDREKQSVYHLAIIATDQNQHALSSSCSVVIYVMDKNDNKPVFTFPTERNNTIYVSNKIPKDYILTKLLATDADVSRNAMIKYSMHPTHGDQHAGVFSVDPALGTVILESDVVRIVDYQLYTLNVTAADRGSPPKSTTAILNIVVNKSIPFYDAQSSEASLSGSNFIIVVSLSSVCGVVAVILIVAIFVIKHQDQTKHQAHKYNCRMEALRTVNASKHSTIQSDLDSPTKSVSSTQGSFIDLHQINSEEMQHYSHDGTNSLASCSTSPCKNPTKDGPWVLPHRDYHSLTKNHAGCTTEGAEVCSQHSGDGSNTDSGRGPSEEGEKQQHGTRPSRLPPYPPPPPARSITSTYGGHRQPAPPYHNDPSPRHSNGTDESRQVMTSPRYHGNNSRVPSHNTPSLDAIPERTYLPNTLTEMKSVVV